MEFKDYKCPVCEAVVPRDLIVFLDHTNQHILDKVKERHPDWAAHEGMCPHTRAASGSGIDSVIRFSFGMTPKPVSNPLEGISQLIKSVELPKIQPFDFSKLPKIL